MCTAKGVLYSLILWIGIWYMFVSDHIDYVVWASLLRTLFSSADFCFCVFGSKTFSLKEVVHWFPFRVSFFLHCIWWPQCMHGHQPVNTVQQHWLSVPKSLLIFVHSLCLGMRVVCETFLLLMCLFFLTSAFSFYLMKVGCCIIDRYIFPLLF